jgi:hypothetical protein
MKLFVTLQDLKKAEKVYTETEKLTKTDFAICLGFLYRKKKTNKQVKHINFEMEKAN